MVVDALDPIVREELELLAKVLDALDRETPRDSRAEPAIVEELERLRALIVSGSDQKDRLAVLPTPEARAT